MLCPSSHLSSSEDVAMVAGRQRVGACWGSWHFGCIPTLKPPGQSKVVRDTVWDRAVWGVVEKHGVVEALEL